MVLEEDFALCCTGLVVVIIIAVVLWILVKGAKFLGYIGQWRTGSALKKMSRDGVTIHQGQQSQTHPQQYAYNQPPTDTQGTQGSRFCPFCGAPRIGGASFCQSCGKRMP